MKIKDITQYLESLAPLALQESYDNCGLIVGNPAANCSKVLISLDCTEAVVDEAIANGCELIIAHHPIVFAGLKKLNGNNYVERTVIKAIQNNIGIYAIHTNLDNWGGGVNHKIAVKLGLGQTETLVPAKQSLLKLVTFVPSSHAEKVKTAMFEAGAGHIGNYSECAFELSGNGSYKANEQANPFLGEKGIRHQEPELRIELILPVWLEFAVVKALKAAHPYEEVAFDLYPLRNEFKENGSGMIGELPEAMNAKDFLGYLKEKMALDCIRFTTYDKPIKKVAVCGGAGSFLLKAAIAKGADAYVSADFKYHEFFDAEERLMIADIGHYESEKFTKNLISELILKKFPTFAILLSEINTNPINYFS